MKTAINESQPVILDHPINNVSDQRKLIALRILVAAALRLILKRKAMKEVA